MDKRQHHHEAAVAPDGHRPDLLVATARVQVPAAAHRADLSSRERLIRDLADALETALTEIGQREADDIQRSEDGRTDWDYEQRIGKLERVLTEVARREKDAKLPNPALRVLLREGIAPHQEDVRRPGICYWCDGPWPHTDHRTEAGDGGSTTNDPAPSGSAATFPYLSDEPAARRITDAKRSGFDVAVGVVREALALGIDHTGKCDAWSDMNESDCTCGRGNLQALAEIPRDGGS